MLNKLGFAALSKDGYLYEEGFSSLKSFKLQKSTDYL